MTSRGRHGPRTLGLPGYPLGHTAGRPNDPELNASIMRDTLTAFEALTEPGAMSHLSYRWSDNDDWKDKVFAPVDTADSSEHRQNMKMIESQDTTHLNIRPRLMRPQPEHSHDGEECLVCAGIDYYD